jgi:hypothetical protein
LDIQIPGRSGECREIAALRHSPEECIGWHRCGRRTDPPVCGGSRINCPRPGFAVAIRRR